MIVRCCYKGKQVSEVHDAKVADHIKSMRGYALDAYFSKKEEGNIFSASPPKKL
jgi:hypothetical protein